MAPEREEVGGGVRPFLLSSAGLLNGDTFVKQMRGAQPEVDMQLPGSARCQAVCGSRKGGK